MSTIPFLIQAVEKGGPQTAETLLPMVYGELRRLAAHRMASQPAGHTLQPTALGHEAYLTLMHQSGIDWSAQEAEGRTRNQFFALASSAMRFFHCSDFRRRDIGRASSDSWRIRRGVARSPARARINH